MARRAGKTIDFKEWNAIPGLETQATTDQVIATALAFSFPASILRMVGAGGLVMLDETKQVDDIASIGFAIGVVSSDAFTAGAGSLPDPLGEPEYPWMYWTRTTLHSFVAAAEEGLGSTVYRFPPFDSRSMRKIKPGQSLVQVIELGGLVGAPTVVMDLESTRVLIGT